MSERDNTQAAVPAQNPQATAMHLSYHEAEAYARWRGGRLPSEFEWEVAMHRSPPLRASAGRVWEWTASRFEPYGEEFAAGPYAEYSAPWFGTHQVLRGGSWATHPRLKYVEYRNFYTPERNDVFAGVRVAYD